MIAAKNTAKKTPKKETKAKVEKKVFRISTDDQSLLNMAALCRFKRLNQSELVEAMAKELIEEKAQYKKFVNFYLTRWPMIEPRLIMNQKLFTITQDTVNSIIHLSWEVVGKLNQSLVVRVALAFFVERLNIPVEQARKK